MSSKKSRLQWSEEAMSNAFKAVKVEDKGLRQAAREFGVPVTTLKRRVDGVVPMNAKPGPSTVLTREEEEKLYQYCLDMCDMGYGLTVDDVQTVAFRIAQSSGRPHPFTSGKAGRDWYDGFLRRFPNLTLRKEEALSYMRAKNAGEKVIEDYFAKLAAVLARLNVLSKPMLIYNADETGFSKVHKSPCKVLARRGQKTVWGITSGERGRTHTLLVCGSASGHALPPLMIFPRVRLPEALKVGAPPGTQFATSPKGWINQEIFSRWLDFFILNVPSARPVLLIYDGHASHLSIEVIEKARANDIHLLCLPAHCTHILQPLDVSVMGSLKNHFGKACKQFLMQNPGRVITEADLAGLVGKAWPWALTPNNLISGFTKTGIYPLNPGRITDRYKAPSAVYAPDSESISSPEQSQHSSTMQSSSEAKQSSSSQHAPSGTDSTSIEEILALPRVTEVPKKTRIGLTSEAQYVSGTPFLDRLRAKRNEQVKGKKKPTKKGCKPRSPKVSYRKRTAAARVRAKARGKPQRDLADQSEEEDQECFCGVCNAMYGTDDKLWIQCSGCENWFHSVCVNVDSRNIPDVFLCMECNC